MTLLAVSRLLNIEKSLNNYLESTLVNTFNYVVVFPRETFGDVLPGSWIEINYIPMNEEFPVTFATIGWGTERQLIVNCNIFEQRQEQIGLPGGLASQYTLTSIVDNICNVLGPRNAIPIRDYDQPGQPTVGVFGWRQVRKQRLAGNVAAGLEQWNVSTTLAFSEEHV